MLTRDTVRPLAIGFVGALLGGLFLLIATTLYVDHTRITAVWNLEVQRAQAQAPPAK